MSLKIKRGESLFITGANGAGKTSLFRTRLSWEASEGRSSTGNASLVKSKTKLEMTEKKTLSPSRPYFTCQVSVFGYWFVARSNIISSEAEKDEVEFDKDDERILECSRVNLVKL